MRMMRKKTVLMCAGGVGFVFCWYFYVYLNDLPQSSRTRLTPRLFPREGVAEDTGGRGTHIHIDYIEDSNKGAGHFVDLDSRLREYCNPPSADLQGHQEGEVSDEFQLISVHIAIRHGDRSPIHSMISHPNTKLVCKFDSRFLMRDKLLSVYLKTLRRTGMNFHPDSDFRNWEVYPNKDVCDGAQLTPLGAYQHLKIGEFLQKKYFSKLFKGNFAYSDIHIRSTGYSRSFQSAIALVFGFLPDFNLQKIQVNLSPDLLFCSSELTGLTCRCPVAYSLKQKADTVAGGFNRNDSEHQMLIKQIADIYGLQPSQIPWLAVTIDIFMTHVCHQMALPCNERNKCVDQSFIKKIWNVLDSDGTKFKSQSKSYVKFAHLVLHPLLSEILQRMKDNILLKDSQKFVLYSGHDITLSPLAVVLGLHSDGKWPPYASRIVFELYTKVHGKNPSQGYIRVLYNGKDRTKHLTFCNKLHHGLCRLQYFENFIDNHLKVYDINNFNTQCTFSLK